MYTNYYEIVSTGLSVPLLRVSKHESFSYHLCLDLSCRHSLKGQLQRIRYCCVVSIKIKLNINNII